MILYILMKGLSGEFPSSCEWKLNSNILLAEGDLPAKQACRRPLAEARRAQRGRGDFFDVYLFSPSRRDAATA